MSSHMFMPHNTVFLQWFLSVAEVQKRTKEIEKFTVSFPDAGTKLAGNSQGQLFRLGSGVLRTGCHRYCSRRVSISGKVQAIKRLSEIRQSLTTANRLIRGIGKKMEIQKTVQNLTRKDEIRTLGILLN